jgi:hypothetical protein
MLHNHAVQPPALLFRERPELHAHEMTLDLAHECADQAHGWLSIREIAGQRNTTAGEGWAGTDE